MNRDEDQLRTLYTDPPVDPAAERRLQVWIATSSMAKGRTRHSGGKRGNVNRGSRFAPPRWGAVLTSAVAVLLIAAASVALFASRGPDRSHQGAATNQHASPPTAATPAPAGPQPAFYVAHLPTQTAAPGAIAVYDSSTGKTIRTLGAAYDPYLQNGFVLSPDRRTLYYNRLNEPAQKIEIVAVPVAGGNTTVLADGSDPQPSPDGARLAYRPQGDINSVAVMNLATRAVTTSALPTQSKGKGIGNLVWLAGSGRLLVTAANYPMARSCPSSVACTQPPSPPVTSDAYVVNTSGPELIWSSLPKVNIDGFGWEQLQAVAPAAGDNVFATSSSIGAASNPTNQERVHAIDPLTGHVVSTLTLPANALLLAIDATGRHLLLRSGSATGQIQAWTPGDGQPTIIGPPAAEAAW